MNKEQPLVSVLMTAYNREKYIAESIQSVLSQNYSNWELIIVDDLSTDSTFALAQSYAIKDIRIKVYTNEKNLGDYINRNKAASFANGEFIKYLDADDIMYPWCLEAMVYFMELFPDAAYGLIASKNLSVNQHFPILYNPKQVYSTYFFKEPILIIGPSGSIIRNSHFKEVNGFSGTPYIGDTELWLKLSTKWPMILLPSDLIWWRIHDEQQSVYESKDDKAMKMRYQMAINFLSDFRCPIYGEWARIAIRNQKNIVTRRLIAKSIQKFDLFDFLKKFKDCNLTLKDIVKAFFKNKVPLINSKLIL